MNLPNSGQIGLRRSQGSSLSLFPHVRCKILAAALTCAFFSDLLEAAPAACVSQEGYRGPATLLYSSAKSVPMKRVFTNPTS